VPAVDGFRGFAALAVVVFHCWYRAGAPALDGGVVRALVCAGSLGVDCFFVISGFVLLLPVVRRGGVFGDVGSYAVRRAARMLPAYWVCVVVLVLSLPLLTGARSPLRSGAGLGVTASHLLVLQHAVPGWLGRAVGVGTGTGFGVNGALWSLTVEVGFYAVLPVVAGAFCRRPVAGLVAAAACAAVWRALAFHLGPLGTLVGADAATDPVRPRLVQQLPGYAAHFAFGMTAAWRFVRAAPSPTSALLLQASAIPALLGAMALAGAGVGPTWYVRYLQDVVPALAFAVLLLGTARAPTWAQAPWTNRLSRWLGDVSYGVYLWHMVAIQAVVRLVGLTPDHRGATFALLLALVVPATLAAGALSRRFIEEPAIAWARRRTTRSP
jgi:peptidoglycan/LPS O-acetylase OafA/YrhL